MAEETRTESLTFVSNDGVTQIHARIWWPAGLARGENGALPRPRGIVQIVHGMAEHISRYDSFARFLAGNGYLVCGHDQLGHGKSVRDRSQWGCLPPKTGKDILIQDIHDLRGIVSARCAPGTPYFVFGHSMGSFETRVYISRHAEGLAGAIICGTGYVDPKTSAAGNAMARLICRLRGADHISGMLHSMADGAYAKAIPDAKSPFDWLSHNRDNVNAYIADPACGYMFSAGGYATLTSLTQEACSPACAQAVPNGLPLLYMAGAEDPVGDNGKGVTTSFKMAQRAGASDAQLKLYPNMRHEILNETGRQAVYTDVLNWLVARS
jgi:alpha-beta hydrolase superfamily lysophospholipase